MEQNWDGWILVKKMFYLCATCKTFEQVTCKESVFRNKFCIFLEVIIASKEHEKKDNIPEDLLYCLAGAVYLTYLEVKFGLGSQSCSEVICCSTLLHYFSKKAVRLFGWCSPALMWEARFKLCSENPNCLS